MPLIPCPECNAQISDKAKACPKCGVPLEKKETKKCFECNSEVEKDKTSCPNCGVDFSLEPKTNEPVNKNATTYTCKFCGYQSGTWTSNCPRCHKDINGNVYYAPPPGNQQPIIIQNFPKRKGVAGIIVFAVLGIILLLAGIAMNNQMHSFNGQLDQFGNYLQGRSEENQMMSLVATGSMVLGGIFLLISLIKLIKR